jgi:hypothetical protein
MSLIALTDHKEVNLAFKEFWSHFESGGERFEKEVAVQGGTSPATLFWYPDLKFWAMQPQKLETRQWCAFGVDNPADLATVPITCEVNIPLEGIDRRCGGVFVRSNNGTIYLAHSGGIGGGRIGVGKAAFLSFYGDETIDTVTWPNKTTSEYIVIGALDDDEFRKSIADFVYKVAEFKALSPKK